MIRVAGRAILLDIEGTTSAIAYVYDVMFPYARKHTRDYLQAHWGESALAEACRQIARDAGAESLDAWCPAPADQPDKVAAEVQRLMDADVKATGLKQLQGLVWENGFRQGQLTAHVYPDVPPQLRRWNEAGIDVRIYSSGSVHAQKLFFAHTEFGDLLGEFRGHYDTTTGGKKESESYARIAADYGLPPAEILFVSDVAAELDAAAQAGLQVALCRRPGNPPQPAHTHPMIHSFDELELSA